MTIHKPAFVYAALVLVLAGCHSHRGEGQGGVPGDADSAEPFHAIAEHDTLQFVGTESFWGGQARGASLTYTTPADPEGTRIAVRRFGGRNGLGLSGSFQGKAFDMTVTPGTCNDGMSDRRFPYTVTLKIGEAVQNGCGWTDKTPFAQAGGG